MKPSVSLIKILFLFYFLNICLPLSAQEKINKPGSTYSFTVIRQVEATDVQNQNATNTCWSFSSLSFFESELLRLGKGKVNLSEMFVVRNIYDLKARNFIRMHGKTNFAEGGGFPDVLLTWKLFGMMPESSYPGKKDPQAPHQHKLLETTLKNILQVAADEKTQKLDFDFLLNTVNATCDAFLGEVPPDFTVDAKSQDPKSYAAQLGLQPEDYVIIGSYSHRPFYTPFILEIPDNWNWQNIYNLPLEEFREVMRQSLEKGFSFAWAADVSESTFLFKDGLALLPEKSWSSLTEEEKQKLSTHPVKQLQVTQELRQKAFDNYETQDDHGMHAIGLVKDQQGTLYYLIKNSWGKERNKCGGYFYASESYLLMKSTSIMLHKSALSPEIRKKLGIL